mmetsp:Transcript_11507/g.22227  ORF Transcript_11507/g.22227 Transcript_11507/m.22227 type:complete len:228 (-) Transcript_11507:273-956(-)
MAPLPQQKSRTAAFGAIFAVFSRRNMKAVMMSSPPPANKPGQTCHSSTLGSPTSSNGMHTMPLKSSSSFAGQSGRLRARMTLAPPLEAISLSLWKCCRRASEDSLMPSASKPIAQMRPPLGTDMAAPASAKRREAPLALDCTPERRTTAPPEQQPDSNPAACGLIAPYWPVVENRFQRQISNPLASSPFATTSSSMTSTAPSLSAVGPPWEPPGGKESRSLEGATLD